MLRWLTAGESHGPALVAILEGMPAGVEVTTADIARGAGPPPARLRPRRADEVRAGRGRDPRRRPARPHPGRPGRDPGRQHRVAEVGDGDGAPTRSTPDVLDGLGPQRAADPAPARPRRPGRHAEVRLRRRPPGARAGQRPRDRGPGRARRAVAKAFLRAGARRRGRSATSSRSARSARPTGAVPAPGRPRRAIDADPVRCLDPAASAAMVAEVDAAQQGRRHPRRRRRGASCYGLPPGLGSHVHWDRRLDARLAGALMGIQAIKGVEVGDGFASRAAPRLAGARRDRAPAGRACAGAPTGPAASRAA